MSNLEDTRVWDVDRPPRPSGLDDTRVRPIFLPMFARRGHPGRGGTGRGSGLRRVPRPVTMAMALVSGGCSMVGYPSPSPPPPPETGAPQPTVAEGRDRPDVVAANPAPPRPTPPADPTVERTYEVMGREYEVFASADGYVGVGLASWYGREFAGRPTASGETFDPSQLTAAHRSLPLSTWVEVTNLENGRKVILRVNDRGPFEDPDERIIDVSRAAAEILDMIGSGVARVQVRALPGPG